MNTAPGPRAPNDLNQLQQQQNEIMVQINSPLNLPCGQLIEGSREDYIKIGVPLFEASIKGDWRAAEAILVKNPEMVRFAITKNYDTPLHIAASARMTEYVEKLLNMMETEDSELQNKSYDTAFSLAASAGNVETAKMMLCKNRALLEIPGSQGKMPLYVAALFGRADMVSYLYGISQKMSSICWTNESRGSVLMRCVEANIFGSREDYIKIGVPLFEASIKGDWRAAEAILVKNPEMVRFAITKNYDTPLHIAASARMTEYVEKLLNMMETEDSELQNKSYDTAFSLAASAGNVETAKMMLCKNRALLEIPGSQGKMPLYVAALFGRADMVSYLYGISQKMSSICWTNESRGSVLMRCVEANIFDVAVIIVNECSQLTTDKRILGDVLLVLAQKTRALNSTKFFYKLQKYTISRIVMGRFAELQVRVETQRRERDALQLLRIIWKKTAIMPDNEIDQILQGPPVEIEEDQHKKITYPSRVPFIAAEMGNVRFIIELIQSYPDLIWAVDDQGLSIFHVAVKHRQEDIYNLLYEIGSMKELITNIEDNNGNNMLHIVAKAANPKRYQNVPGDALQMQRELLWFKEVLQMIPPTYIEKKNRVGETPHEIFTKDHEKLLVSSEKWIKETAPQCLVGATIIATMAFTAAFTAPGGYDQDTGIPMLLHKPAFLLFVIADAFSLIASSASILTLLSMLTSRYVESDFLKSLPRKLMFSLATLYLSIVTMMIAFCASLFVLYSSTKIKRIPIMVSCLGAEMLSLLVYLQYPFLKDIFYSTYHPRLLFNPKKHVLYKGYPPPA